MKKLKKHQMSDGSIMNEILGTSWSILEISDLKSTYFRVNNCDTDIDDLFFNDMPEQYKTIKFALDAIQEFLNDNDYFEPEIHHCEMNIKMYQEANLTYMK